MHKYLLMIATILFISTGTAFATGDSANGSGYKPYTCEPNDAGVETCYCAGRYDCNYMISDGVCDVPMPELGSNASGNDMACDDNFGGVGEYVCECSAEITRPGVSRRPDRFDAPNESALPEPSARDRRRDHRPTTSTDDIIAPNNRTTDSDNEVVPARRGNAPETDNIVAPNNRTTEEETRARRERSGFENVPDGSSNTINLEERRAAEDEAPSNEVVPARRGRPRTEDPDAEEEEEETEQPTRRDHRR